MPTAPIPPDLRAAAPSLAARMRGILAPLAALVAHAFLRHPTRAPLILALWRYLNRTAARFERLMAHIAAGRLPRTSRHGRSGPRPAPLPRQPAWLIRDLGYRAGAYRSQLESLLAEPAVAQLLAITPAAARLLRPLCRMLAIPAPGPAPIQAVPPPPAAASAASPASGLPERPPPAPLPDAPCPRSRWPWFFNPAARPA
jgi:hypothetical protein